MVGCAERKQQLAVCRPPLQKSEGDLDAAAADSLLLASTILTGIVKIMPGFTRDEIQEPSLVTSGSEKEAAGKGFFLCRDCAESQRNGQGASGRQHMATTKGRQPGEGG